MPTIEPGMALTFDDVLLVPQYSDILPREANVETRLTRKLRMRIPILSSAMDTVTEARTAIAMAKEGGAGVIHKNLTPDDQAVEVARVKVAGGEKTFLVGAAIGPGRPGIQRAEALLEAGADFIVVDTAHGHSKGVIDTVTQLKRRHPDCEVIAGNVATPEGVRALAEVGADAVKVGIGPGSICTTRVVAGVGVPQVTALMTCAEEAARHDIPIIADGGIRQSGDIVKALACGAEIVMLGNLLAGTDEAPGEVVQDESGRKFKVYRGMGSLGAMSAGSKDRYGQEGLTVDKLVPEGVEGRVPARGPLSKVIYQLVGGLKSGMGYLGARNLQDLAANACFIRITGSGLRESNVHDIDI